MELQQKDRALVELLQEKVGLFAEMTHFQVEEESGSGLPLPPLPRGLFRSESLEAPRGERLLQDAIREGEEPLGRAPRCHAVGTHTGRRGGSSRSLHSSRCARPVPGAGGGGEGTRAFADGHLRAARSALSGAPLLTFASCLLVRRAHCPGGEFPGCMLGQRRPPVPHGAPHPHRLSRPPQSRA